MRPRKVLMTRSLVSMVLVVAFASACGSKDTGDTGSSEPLIKSTASAKATATATADTPTPAQSTPPAPTGSASATLSASAAASASAAPGGHGGLPGVPALPPDAQQKAACIQACVQKNMSKGLAAASQCQAECNH